MSVAAGRPVADAYACLPEPDDGTVTVYPRGADRGRVMVEWISSDTVIPERDWR